MEKIKLACFINFSNLQHLENSPYIYTLALLSKKFGKIYLININYLSFSKKNLNKYKFKKYKNYFNLIDPKNFLYLNNFLKKERIIVLNSIVRNLSNLPLLLLLNINKIKLLEISNLGNLQIGTDEFLKLNNLRSFLQIKIKNNIKKMLNLFSIIGLISKVDCKFTSNKKIYLDFKKRNYLKRFFSYYKNVQLVRSNIYESLDKEVIKEKYIVLLDVMPTYSQFTDYKKVNKDDIRKHYNYLDNLLDNLSKIFKKKIIVCIHPQYSLKFYKEYLPKKKIVKFRTEEFIKKSYIVLTFNSSAIVNAIKYDKKIISIQSFLFKGVEYSSSIYQKRLKNEKITLKKIYQINGKKLLKKLIKKTKNYKKFKELYFGFQTKKKSSDEIAEYILKTNRVIK